MLNTYFYKSSHKFLNNQSGVSLVEVMIASGIGVSLALVMATMTTNMQKSVKGVERSTDWVDLKSTIRSNLLSETKCIQMFNLGATVIDTDIAGTLAARNSINVNLGGTPLTVGTIWGGVRVTTSNLNAIPAAGPQHVTTLDVTVSTNRNPAATTPEVMGAQSYNFSFRVAFYAAATAPDQTILNRCISAENDTSELYGAINALTDRVTALELSLGNTPATAGSTTTALARIDNALGRIGTAEGNIGSLQTGLTNLGSIVGTHTVEINQLKTATTLVQRNCVTQSIQRTGIGKDEDNLFSYEHCPADRPYLDSYSVTRVNGTCSGAQGCESRANVHYSMGASKTNEGYNGTFRTDALRMSAWDDGAGEISNYGYQGTMTCCRIDPTP